VAAAAAARWIKVAVLVCLLWASGCANDDESQSKEKQVPMRSWRKDDPPERRSNRVFTPDVLGNLAYRPRSIGIGEGAAIDGIRWKRYGGQTALGTGSLNGKPVTIRLRLKNICAGELAYLRWAVDPDGSGRNPEFSPIMSPHDWLDTCYPEPGG
jgi:hypothetical protein